MFLRFLCFLVKLLAAVMPNPSAMDQRPSSTGTWRELRMVRRDKKFAVAVILRVIGTRVIAPEPAQHFGHDGPALFVGVGADAPAVIHVVALLRQRLNHLQVLRVPIAFGLV